MLYEKFEKYLWYKFHGIWYLTKQIVYGSNLVQFGVTLNYSFIIL
jgi:hypothetical protein